MASSEVFTTLNSLKSFFNKQRAKKLSKNRKQIRVKSLKKYRRRKNPLTEGFIEGNNQIKKWRQQLEPPKVYVLGKRIHHGPVGVLLAALGYYYNKPKLIGYGSSLALDDIDDFQDWFKFEDKPNYTNENIIEIL